MTIATKKRQKTNQPNKQTPNNQTPVQGDKIITKKKKDKLKRNTKMYSNN